jgi:hypothetical protein
MKLITIIILALFSSHLFSASKVHDLQNDELIKKNALTIISKRVIDKFKPETESLNLLRHSRSGIATYLFSTKDGKFRGEAHCIFSGLLLFKENVTNYDETCFLVNVYESDSKGINGVGRQVGIY